MIAELKHVTDLDRFTAQLLRDYAESTLKLSLDAECSDSASIWINFLNHESVRNLLCKFLRNLDRSNRENGSSQSPQNENRPDCCLAPADDDGERKLLLLSAICSLQLFIADNFLCFMETREPFDSFHECRQTFDDFFARHTSINCFDRLCVDGEKLIPVVRSCTFLGISRLVFEHLVRHMSPSDEQQDSSRLLLLAWSMRSAIVHQVALESATNSLYVESLSYIDRIESLLDDRQLRRKLKLQILNEFTSICLHFGDIERARRYYASAQKCSRLKLELTGALGTRTIYQTKAVPQLMVRLENRTDNDDSEEDDEKSEIVEAENSKSRKVNLPKNEKLEDDTLLQDVRFVCDDKDEKSSQNVAASPISPQPRRLTECEQCCVMIAIKCAHRFGAQNDTLLREQQLAYIYHLLERTTIWAVAFSLLERRSTLERDNRRRVERSMKQLETLSIAVRGPYELVRFLTREAANRLPYFFAILPPPFWSIEKSLGDLLASLGVTKAALDAYLRVQSWPDVIACYRQLGRPDKAEEIVRRKLREQQDRNTDSGSGGGDRQPELYCLLGEITGEIEHFRRSWEISNHRYARAAKMLALHYFDIREFDQALCHFRESIAANSMQCDVWYRIGFIELSNDNWSAAATAYRRVLQFDDQSFEAWNNLSKAYIKMGEKRRALRTLQEAIRCNYDEWKLWDNFIAVAADVGAFGETIFAWHRLIELRGKYCDDTIGDILTRAIVDDDSQIRDCDGELAGAYLREKVSKLFARITSIGDCSAAVWRNYARILIHENERETSRITVCLQRCHRKIIGDVRWTTIDLDTLRFVAQHCVRLAEEYEQVAEIDRRSNDSANRQQILSGCRLALKSALTQIVRAKTNLELETIATDGDADRGKKLKQLEEEIAQIETKLGAAIKQQTESSDQ